MATECEQGRCGGRSETPLDRLVDIIETELEQSGARMAESGEVWQSLAWQDLHPCY